MAPEIGDPPQRRVARGYALRVPEPLRCSGKGGQEQAGCLRHAPWARTACALGGTPEGDSGKGKGTSLDTLRTLASQDIRFLSGRGQTDSGPRHVACVYPPHLRRVQRGLRDSAPRWAGAAVTPSRSCLRAPRASQPIAAAA
jgi:hypothetical protein